MSVAVETLVAGAGISGLAYAHARGADADLVVVEAAARPGGWVHTVEVSEHRLRYEAGPEALSGAAASVRDLAGRLGLDVHEVAGAAKRFVVKGGAPLEVPLSPPRLLTTRLLSWRAKLRLATEPFRAHGRALDGSIADFARHRLGEEALATLVDPLVSGVHAGDPEELSLRACFPQLVELLAEHGSVFRALRAKDRARTGPAPGLWKPAGGMQRLTDALARALGDRLRTGVAVERLEPRSDGFEVWTSDGAYHARRVVLALPLAPTRALLAEALPPLARGLADLRTESLAGVFHAWPRAAVAHPLDGFGYLVPRRENLRHLGTLFSSSIDPACAPDDRVLLRTLVGGARAPEEAAQPADELVRAVTAEVAPLLGLSGAPTWTCVERYPGALPRFDLAHPARLAGLAEATPGNLTVLGNFTRAIGLSGLVSDAEEHARADGSATA